MRPSSGQSMRRQPLKARLRYGSKQCLFVTYMTSYLMLAFMIGSGLWSAHPSQSSDSGLQLRGNNRLMTETSAVIANQHPAKMFDALEVWARGPAQLTPKINSVCDLLSANTIQRLRSLCGRCLYRTLTSYVRVKDHDLYSCADGRHCCHVVA